MAQSVAVQCKVIGDAAGPGLAPVQLQWATERVSVRELIRRAVAAQIDALLLQQRAEAGLVQLALARQYLTAKDVAVQAEAGRIRLPTAAKSPPVLDVEAEIRKALHGFEQRAFRVLVDGETLDSLEDELVVAQASKIVFLRLMPLVGG